MKKTLLLVVAAAFGLAFQYSASAQQKSAREEIHENILLSGANYTAYVDPTEPLTAAPKGYEPFYLSHYGRHGSRWLIGDWQYDQLDRILKRAHDKGVLSDLGEELYEEYCHKFYPTVYKRLGELTNVGERQHHRIGKRMGRNFPEIFNAKNSELDARSTVVIRCILSMEAECEELQAMYPNLYIHNDVSESFQYYLNQDWSKELQKEERERKAQVFDYFKAYVNPERFWNALVKDPAYRDEEIKSRTDVMRRLFKVCANMQSHGEVPGLQPADPTLSRKHQSPALNFYKYFTEEETYNLWKCYNIEWYVSYIAGNATKTQKNLLENIIATCDTTICQPNYHGATLRFGHEVCVLPLAGLLELNNSGVQIPLSDMDKLDLQWVNYRIFPMGCNIQLIFYRPKNGKKGDILVKALLNEREATLPVTPVQGPYYKWEELKKYYQEKLK